MTDGRNLDMVGTTEVGNRLTDFSDISVIKNISVITWADKYLAVFYVFLTEFYCISSDILPNTFGNPVSPVRVDVS